jgi:putative acetyltransferase
MIVRDMRPEDFPDLRANYYECYDERDAGLPIGIVLFRERPSEEAETAWFEGVRRSFDAGNLVSVVAESDGHVVGTCSVSRVGPNPDSEVGHVGGLGILVRRDHRGKGVGSALLEGALERCRGKFEVVQLAVFIDNEGAQRLYRRFGFQEIGVYPRAIKRGDRYIDERLMVRVL